VKGAQRSGFYVDVHAAKNELHLADEEDAGAETCPCRIRQLKSNVSWAKYPRNSGARSCFEIFGLLSSAVGARLTKARQRANL